MLKGLLGKRYTDDGREAFRLTAIQREARNKIRIKLNNGEYPVVQAACPLCGGNEARILSEKDTYGLPTSVVLCLICDLLYTTPRLSEKALEEFYTNEYRQLDRVVPDIQEYFLLETEKGKRIYAFLEDQGVAPRLKGRVVLEVGCGAGGVLGVFRNEGYDVIGCDLVPQHLQYGRDKHGLDLRYGGFNIVQEIIASTRETIGLVIFEQVLEHIPDPATYLTKLMHLLPNECLLYVGVPGLRNIDAHYGSDFLRYIQLPHLTHFDLTRLSLLLRKCGFSMIAGDETIRSIFQPDAKGVLSLELVTKDTAAFLELLERRRKYKQLWKIPLRMLIDVGELMAESLDRSSLSPIIKTTIISLMKRIHRWIIY